MILESHVTVSRDRETQILNNENAPHARSGA